MSWYDKDSVTCLICWLRFSTPIDCHWHRMHTKGQCTPTVRRFRRMRREAPALAATHASKFPSLPNVVVSRTGANTET